MRPIVRVNAIRKWTAPTGGEPRVLIAQPRQGERSSESVKKKQASCPDFEEGHHKAQHRERRSEGGTEQARRRRREGRRERADKGSHSATAALTVAIPGGAVRGGVALEAPRPSTRLAPGDAPGTAVANPTLQLTSERKDLQAPVAVTTSRQGARRGRSSSRGCGCRFGSPCGRRSRHQWDSSHQPVAST